MTHKAKSLLILGAKEAASSWRSALEQSGWGVQSLPWQALPMQDLCCQHQVIVLIPDGDDIASIAAMVRDCPESEAAAFLPVLANPSARDMLALIRLGICDLLLRPFSEAELVATVERVARQRGLYQENRDYSQELEKTNKELRDSLNILKMDQIAGRQVQKNLLPQSPLVFNGYSVAHRIIPSLYLSGDFVAYNLVFDRYILFYLADVSGHGASSAFVTILLRFILKRIIRKHVRDNDVAALAKAPAGFIEHVNRQLLATGLEKQLTMFAGAIDTHTNMLRYGVAAQVPMPVFVVDDDARFLPGKGKIIGLFEQATWSVEEIALPKQFRLVMVSDGLLETLPGKGLAAQEQYLLETLAQAPANHQQICTALGLDNIAEAADDISILTICRESTT